MFYKTRFILSLLVFCAALTACGDNNNQASQEATTNSPEVANTEATEQQDVTKTETAPATGKIEVGMSEQAITDLLGAPTLVQTHTLDDLTITHSEWINDAGTTSVQFQNGKVKFNQFTPANK